MELWDLYTKNRVLTGEEYIRGEELPKDRYHLIVDVWIVNSEGKYLISQRHASRPAFPLFWECVAGSVLKGEDSLQGAVREVKEEVGIDLSPESGRFLCTKVRGEGNGRKINTIKDVWVFPYDGEVDLSKATEKEVATSKWMTPEEVQRLFDAGKMVPSLSYFFEDVVNRK